MTHIFSGIPRFPRSVAFIEPQIAPLSGGLTSHNPLSGAANHSAIRFNGADSVSIQGSSSPNPGQQPFWKQPDPELTEAERALKQTLQRMLSEKTEGGIPRYPMLAASLMSDASASLATRKAKQANTDEAETIPYWLQPDATLSSAQRLDKHSILKTKIESALMEELRPVAEVVDRADVASLILAGTQGEKSQERQMLEHTVSTEMGHHLTDFFMALPRKITGERELHQAPGWLSGLEQMLKATFEKQPIPHKPFLTNPDTGEAESPMDKVRRELRQTAEAIQALQSNIDIQAKRQLRVLLLRNPLIRDKAIERDAEHGLPEYHFMAGKRILRDLGPARLLGSESVKQGDATDGDSQFTWEGSSVSQQAAWPNPRIRTRYEEAAYHFVVAKHRLENEGYQGELVYAHNLREMGRAALGLQQWDDALNRLGAAADRYTDYLKNPVTNAWNHETRINLAITYQNLGMAKLAQEVKALHAMSPPWNERVNLEDPMSVQPRTLDPSPETFFQLAEKSIRDAYQQDNPFLGEPHEKVAEFLTTTGNYYSIRYHFLRQQQAEGEPVSAYQVEKSRQGAVEYYEKARTEYQKLEARHPDNATHDGERLRHQFQSHLAHMAQDRPYRLYGNELADLETRVETLNRAHNAETSPAGSSESVVDFLNRLLG
ncbi:MAG: hypothetical protein SFZ03_09810 [Candidatus Melainabacteria bacterium]|nr:hypothetical protein [Candidatus Melainabacteria bacterium]